jgi:hypothetical protein
MTDHGLKPRPALDALKPGGVAVNTPEPATSRVDRAGEALGFKSREPVEVVSRRKSVGPTTALNVRCPVRVFNPFAKFCEEEGRLSYWEGLERLMELAGIDENGKRRA